MYWPALVPADEIDQVVVLDDGTRIRVEPAPTGPPADEPIEPLRCRMPRRSRSPRAPRSGDHFGARSGDKGGNANLGVWARDDAGYAWLDGQPDRRAAP